MISMLRRDLHLEGQALFDGEGHTCFAVIAAAVVCGVLAFRHFHPGGSENTESKPEYEIAETETPPNDLLDTLRKLDVGDTFTAGAYEQDNDPSNGTEPIEWQVLAIENGRMLVISRYGLDAQPYNEEWVDVTWETCTLRSWLNGTFYNTAFSHEEQALIPAVTIRNDDNPYYGTWGGYDTTDRVFLLSLDEVNTYFDSDDARCCTATEYAIAQGAWTYDAEANGGDYEEYDGNCVWWLRSPGINSNGAANVNIGGYVYDDGFGVNLVNDAVRPAMWIDLGESEQPDSGIVELSGYLRASMAQVEQDFPELGGFERGVEVDGKPVYSIRQNGLSFTASYYGTEDLSAEPAIDTIRIFDDTDCAIVGITYGMPFEAAVETLDQQGFLFEVYDYRLITNAVRDGLRVVVESSEGRVNSVGIQIPGESYPFQ